MASAIYPDIQAQLQREIDEVVGPDRCMPPYLLTLVAHCRADWTLQCPVSMTGMHCHLFKPLSLSPSVGVQALLAASSTLQLKILLTCVVRLPLRPISLLVADVVIGWIRNSRGRNNHSLSLVISTSKLGAQSFINRHIAGLWHAKHRCTLILKRLTHTAGLILMVS